MTDGLNSTIKRARRDRNAQASGQFQRAIETILARSCEAQPTERQHIGNQIEAVLIFALAEFVQVHRAKKQLLFRAAIFAKQKTNTAEQERSPDCQSHYGDKYAVPDSIRSRNGDGSLRADYRQLSVLYWAARESNVLITSTAT